MIDGVARRWLEPGLDRSGRWLARRGVRADHVTVAACVAGLCAAALIAAGYMITGLVVIVLSRVGDGLDGAVARATRKTDFGGYLDITLDFVFYGALPFGFVLFDPAANGLAGAALILSFYINGASFLAYAILAEKRKLTTTQRGSKSIYFTTGLAEAGETFAAFALFCLFPGWFPLLAWIFAAICLYTAISRIVEARAAFGEGGSEA
ncbi:CDP-alcohol phosphatidyltransferase family protein [Hoeflea olei]|uniref:Phosphatidylglycerophosphate synthase n=1 Tax=Hoeflea olei TaxID=1480615 RepID=A0A1C1YSA5_9HYPH|nr:CDP-alcohol phosphatidyltransferase family protein [Hoeflea olei]OCW56405.1 hypothetical protein AWJ14_20200 [Hoeflea olei]